MAGGPEGGKNAGRVEGCPPPGQGTAPSEAQPEGQAPLLNWVRAAQEGDSAALEALFERYRTNLQRVARTRLGNSRQSLEVSDVLQTTLRRAVRSLKTLQPASHQAVDAWFLQILDRAILDHHRQRQAQRRGGGRATASLDQSSAGTTAGSVQDPRSEEAFRGLERDELAAGVWRRLSAQDRVLVRARVIEGAPWERVAQVIGATGPEAARKRFESLRKRIQDQLGAAAGEEFLRSL